MTAPVREMFSSRLTTLLTVIGVAVGLGNVWRFPYMVGKFGGAAFVLFYVLISVAIGVPALMAEFALGRYARRGPVGAFARGGLPFGRQVGWFFFCIVVAALGYYTTVIGWVLYYTVGQLVTAVTPSFDPSAILPPDTGFVARSFVLQLGCTAFVAASCAFVVHRGLRSGIEKASAIIVPALLTAIVILMIRSLTLPGAFAGVEWFILKVRFADLNANVMMAAIGHAIFSLSLGGTFMVVYGSYLSRDENPVRPALWTVAGDTGSALLAGFAILPAVFALGMEPKSGPGLLFSTLPQVFAAIPAGWFFGFIFFAGLCGAGYLSAVGAFEVLVAGLTDNTKLSRARAAWLIGVAVTVIAIPPMINNAIFVPWDLTFGSGMQTLGALLAVLTVGWCMNRSDALRELSADGGAPIPRWLFHWIRFGIPAVILSAGIWWLLTNVLGLVQGV